MPRRAILKVITGAPLVVSLGLVASPLMRFLKPTMQAGNFFQTADLPTADKPPRFNLVDLPEIWNCLPFMLPMKYLVFNPEQYEVRNMPGFFIRTGENNFVAFSRICPRQSDHILNFIIPVVDGCCGCPDKSCGSCLEHAKTPVLKCPCDGSVFDIADNGRVLVGPASRPPRQFILNRNGKWISIERLEIFGIA